MLNTKPVAVIAGVETRNSAALERRFAAAGYAIATLARRQVTLESPDHVRRLACDIGNPNSVANAFARVRNDLGVVDLLLYNVGTGVFGDVETIAYDQFEQAWRDNAYGALLCSRQVIMDMKAKKSGAIIFIGATTSRRSGAQTAAFAPAKAAQRSLAESMARALWPAGIHVALIVVDGIVGPDYGSMTTPDELADGFVDFDGVAEMAFQLCCQTRRAWSFEVEARSYAQTW